MEEPTRFALGWLLKQEGHWKQAGATHEQDALTSQANKTRYNFITLSMTIRVPGQLKQHAMLAVKSTTCQMIAGHSSNIATILSCSTHTARNKALRPIKFLTVMSALFVRRICTLTHIPLKAI